MYTTNGQELAHRAGDAYYDADRAVETQGGQPVGDVGCEMPIYEHHVNGMCIRGEFLPAREAFTAFRGMGQDMVLNIPTNRYPWHSFSESTQSLQFSINYELQSRGMPTIGTDGVLGAETCGAQKYLYDQGLSSHEPPDTCRGYQYPPAPAPQSPAPSPAPPPPDEAESAPAGMTGGWGKWGWWLAAGALIAGGVYVATRPERQDT